MNVSSLITQLHIVIEFFESSFLFDLLFSTKNDKPKMNIACKTRIALELCCAVAYLHLLPQPIIHRDIKPSNILINKHFFAKLCDLG